MSKFCCSHHRAKIVDKGLFSSGHVTYKIEVPSKGWFVERRFKEFAELRVELERLNPSYLVPPIWGYPKEDEIKPSIMVEMKQQLQKFLDDLLAHPLLGCSELLYYFLYCPIKDGKKSDEFQRRIKLYSLMPIPKEAEEMKTDNGVAVVALSEELNGHIETMHDSVAKLKQLYQT